MRMLHLNFALVALLTVLGCTSESEEAEKFTVTGTIGSNGEPLANLGVGFFGKETNFIGGAETNENGRFEVELPADEYAVTVSLPTEEVQEVPGSPPMEVIVEDDRVPKSAQSESTTRVRMTVTEDTTDVQLDLAKT